MARDLGAESLGEHLRAETDAKEGALFGKRHIEPVDFLDEMGIGVVGAGRAAENDSSTVIVERRRQCLAKHRAANIELDAARRQHLANPAGRRVFLMQHHEDRPVVAGHKRKALGIENFANGPAASG